MRILRPCRPRAAALQHCGLSQAWSPEGPVWGWESAQASRQHRKMHPHAAHTCQPWLQAPVCQGKMRDKLGRRGESVSHVRCGTRWTRAFLHPLISDLGPSDVGASAGHKWGHRAVRICQHRSPTDTEQLLGPRHAALYNPQGGSRDTRTLVLVILASDPHADALTLPGADLATSHDFQLGKLGFLPWVPGCPCSVNVTRGHFVQPRLPTRTPGASGEPQGQCWGLVYCRGACSGAHPGLGDPMWSRVAAGMMGHRWVLGSGLHEVHRGE